MKNTTELHMSIRITKLQAFALLLINYPRVLLGLEPICPRWCYSLTGPHRPKLSEHLPMPVVKPPKPEEVEVR